MSTPTLIETHDDSMTEAEAEEALTEAEEDDPDAVARPAVAPQRKPSLTPSMFSARTTGGGSIARARRASDVEVEPPMTRHDLDNKYFHKDLLIFRNWDAFRFVSPEPCALVSELCKTLSAQC